MSAAFTRSFLPRVARFHSGILRRYKHDGFAALNVYKDANAAPKELDDSEYPDWLWRIQDPLPTKEELFREADALFARGGYDEVFEKMTEKDLKRLFKLDTREKIKVENARRRGGNVV